MTVKEALAEGKKLLKTPFLIPHSSLDTPDLDAALLLAEILQCSREKLIAKANENISGTERENFLRLIKRRKSGECVAYILGRKEFRSLDFTVNPQVLVPRPDTETLVEAALEYIDSLEPPVSVLDLCTGSGAVAISLKNERPFLSVSASDISGRALEIAALNAAKLDATINIIHSDIFDSISGKFSIIVSNPPYIPSKELSGLAPELQREPRIALDGGGSGLCLIEKIISLSPGCLLPNGVLLLEAAPEQMPAIKALLEKHCFISIRTFKDLGGRERVISGNHR